MFIIIYYTCIYDYEKEWNDHFIDKCNKMGLSYVTPGIDKTFKYILIANVELKENVIEELGQLFCSSNTSYPKTNLYEMIENGKQEEPKLKIIKNHRILNEEQDIVVELIDDTKLLFLSPSKIGNIY